jgi:hypothetical protein
MTHQHRIKGHGLALMLLALGIPLGEGIALLGMGLVILFCLIRRYEMPWCELRDGLAGPWFLGWLSWFAIGLALVFFSGQGVLHSSEVFRHAPILAGPAVFLSVRSLPKQTLNKVLGLLVVMLGAAALFGLYQWFTGTHPMVFLARADSSIASQSRIPGSYEAMAAGGFYFHRLKMAHVLVLAFGILFPILFDTSRRKAWHHLLCGLFLVCLVGTFAKASWGALLVASVLTAYCLRQRLRAPVLLTSLGGVVFLLYLDNSGALPWSGRLGGSLSIRTMIWGQALEVIRDYPGGVGLGNYSEVVARYYDQVMPAFHIRTYPHNLLLSWWVECGAAGMLVMVVAWSVTFIKAIKGAANERLPSLNRTRYASLAFSLCAFWIIGLTHDVFYHQSVALMFFSGVGWLLGQLPDGEVSDRI